MFLADIQNPVHSVWFEVANYVEFIILCTNIVVITITARMVTSSTPLHRNLVLLLYNLVVTGLVSLPVCIYTGLGIVFISVTCYFIFNAINQRRYQKSISVGTTYTLSQKFQLSENIRTSSLLSRACVVSALMNTLQCLAFVSVHHLEDDPLLAQIMFTVGNFSIACYGLVLPLLGLSLDKRVVGLFKRQLSLIFPFVDAEKSEDSELNLQRADGAPMVFDQEQEVNKYFGELNKAWA
ncbi:Sre G protein-coupled chemoreceptor [Ancylostoma ceylanicum]|uniref:Sre G protein-coupled chemoreceptor n=1 Tax=Ancylostoma ceylanicum TaxID=53326 RepID=A0A0D6M8V1_9BILA|nr:Sre G protein-coupled chemoreceptor [Ancylostoma ceylanicum]